MKLYYTEAHNYTCPSILWTERGPQRVPITHPLVLFCPQERQSILPEWPQTCHRSDNMKSFQWLINSVANSLLDPLQYTNRGLVVNDVKMPFCIGKSGFSRTTSNNLVGEPQIGGLHKNRTLIHKTALVQYFPCVSGPLPSWQAEGDMCRWVHIFWINLMHKQAPTTLRQLHIWLWHYGVLPAVEMQRDTVSLIINNTNVFKVTQHLHPATSTPKTLKSYFVTAKKASK